MRRPEHNEAVELSKDGDFSTGHSHGGESHGDQDVHIVSQNRTGKRTGKRHPLTALGGRKWRRRGRNHSLPRTALWRRLLTAVLARKLSIVWMGSQALYSSSLSRDAVVIVTASGASITPLRAPVGGRSARFGLANIQVWDLLARVAERRKLWRSSIKAMIL